MRRAWGALADLQFNAREGLSAGRRGRFFKPLLQSDGAAIFISGFFPSFMEHEGGVVGVVEVGWGGGVPHCHGNHRARKTQREGSVVVGDDILVGVGSSL